MNQVSQQPGGRMLRSQTLKLSYVFPIVLQWRQLAKKGFLIPAALTILASMTLFWSATKSFDYFAWAFAVYCAIIFLYFVYRLCGKPRSWVVLLSAMGIGVLFAYPSHYNVWGVLHLFFANFVAAAIFPHGSLGGFGFNFVAIGLVEEGTKFAVVLLFYGVALKCASPWREQIGVAEPLDGIVLGAASGAGFALFETVHQYIPNALAKSIPIPVLVQFTNTKILPHSPKLAKLPPVVILKMVQGFIASNFSMQAIINIFHVNGALAMQLLITRSLNDLAGHMAWAALFGYALGLAVLKPKKGWMALPLCYALVAALHALWDSSTSLPMETQVIAGLLSYSLLAAAILQARQLSPTREFNFATQTLERLKTPAAQPANSVQNAPVRSQVAQPRVSPVQPAGYALILG
ncbi:MAG: PrsW family intramembrane metalloprotease, partial [Candidatus Binataceae bacterium]